MPSNLTQIEDFSVILLLGLILRRRRLMFVLLLHDVELQEASYWVIGKETLLVLTCRWCVHHVRRLLRPFILFNLIEWDGIQ
jgi:hypothetical protein